MNRRLHVLLAVITLMAFLTIAAAPTPQQPDVTISLVDGLPDVMHLGQTYTVEVHVQVNNGVPYLFAAAMPTAFYPGRYMVANVPARARAGTEATLFVTFKAKNLTAGLPEMEGVPANTAPVAVVAGARYKGGITVSESFWFNVEVVP